MPKNSARRLAAAAEGSTTNHYHRPFAIKADAAAADGDNDD